MNFIVRLVRKVLIPTGLLVFTMIVLLYPLPSAMVRVKKELERYDHQNMKHRNLADGKSPAAVYAIEKYSVIGPTPEGAWVFEPILPEVQNSKSSAGFEFEYHELLFRDSSDVFHNPKEDPIVACSREVT